MADVINKMMNPINNAPAHVAPEITQRQPVKPVSKPVEPQKQASPTPDKIVSDIKSKEYGPVIARSEDGDTVRIKVSSADIEKKQNSYSFKDAYESAQKDDLQDFNLPEKTGASKPAEMTAPTYEPSTPDFDIDLELKKPAVKPETTSITKEPEYKPEYKSETKPEIDNTKETAKSANTTSWTPKPTTLAGFTEAQLRKMYRNGEISQNKYQNELASRTESKESTAQMNSMVSNEVSKEVVELSDMENTDKALDLLKNDEATVPTEVRAEILQKMQEQTM